MEIPGNEIRLKNKTVQDRAKVSGKEAASKGNGSGSAKPAGGSSEQIALSSKARDIQTAQAVIKATPDIRVDKVNKVKQSLENGSYNVKSQDIANKMMKYVLSDPIISS
jgi:negative regulator of flagellin synthesis FlgM